jgi:integrase
MRLPNKYGSVYKLSGKRRNPWAARRTVGWKQIPEKKKSYPIYQFIGYYPTRAEALQALAAFNENPYDLHLDTITFEEVYDKWSDVHFETIKNPNGYKAAFKLCSGIQDMKFSEIKLDHLQRTVDISGKNTPTLKTLKNMWGLMYDYAVIHEIVTPDKRDIVRYVDISKPGNPNAYNRKPFTKKAIKAIWDAEASNEYLSVVLLLIYTGVRIGELLNLQKQDVHLEERWFFVKEAKTNAGVRDVPIAEKIVPFFEHWIQKDCNYLICTPDNHPFTYRNYYDSYWIPLMNGLSLDRYTPHCTRYTCVSLLTEAGVDERIIQKIVGHKGQNVTQAVYTHLDLPSKLEAINRI